ncbi:MAG TPA: glycosyltransferase family 9 protein [Terriglobales bacterium]|nr:glycosyltransferase family 9 protein [Terriglobales bacterium]
MNDSSVVATPKKILIVRLGAMGDILHAIPAAIMLKCSFPDAEIGWVMEKRWADLLAPIPFITRRHLVDTRSWRKHPLDKRHEVLTALREIRASKYNIVVDFQGAIKSAAFALLSGAPRRYGFNDPWEKPASLAYTNTVITRATHVVQQNSQLAEKIVEQHGGIINNEYYCPVYDPLPEFESWAENKIAELRLRPRFALLNPGAGWGAKQWPAERYAEVTRELGNQGIRSLINYGPGEEELARIVESQSDGHAIAATFTISQLIAVTRRASLFIGGDTGPLHLADFFHDVPIVAIFGPTDPARTGPQSKKSIVLRDPSSITSHKRVKNAEAGLLNITAAEVLHAARELLATKGVNA